MTVLEAPDKDRIAEGLIRGIETATALFLDKPPAGSATNFGLAGMKHLAKMLVDQKNPKGWPKIFEPGPVLAQALVGRHAQPGFWHWIEMWGTQGGADQSGRTRVRDIRNGR